MPKTSPFLELSNSIGYDKLPERKMKQQEYRRISIVDMRHDVISRAHETIRQLSSNYKKRSFRAPMAKSILNGVQIKVGYGKRNQKIMIGEKGDIELKPRCFTHSEIYQAIHYLQKAIEAVETGELDDALTRLLHNFNSRFDGNSSKNKATKNKINPLDKKDEVERAVQ